MKLSVFLIILWFSLFGCLHYQHQIETNNYAKYVKEQTINIVKGKESLYLYIDSQRLIVDSLFHIKNNLLIKLSENERDSLKIIDSMYFNIQIKFIMKCDSLQSEIDTVLYNIKKIK